MNVCFVGVGNIGRRHIQSSLSLSDNYNFFIVDNCSDSIKKSKILTGNKKNYFFYDTLPLRQNIDLLFLATTAAHRFEIFKNVLSNHNVKNIIFEKVVFQKPSHYAECLKILQDQKVNCWINNWPRYAPYYRDVKENIKDKTPIAINVSGSYWGLACNASHFMELMAFLSDGGSFDKIKCNFSQSYKSKRKPFVDFYGEISAKTNLGHTINLIDRGTGSESLVVEITQKDNRFMITNEKDNVLVKSNISGFREKRYDFVFQSKTSGGHIDAILKNKNPELPTYRESYEWHANLISCINSEMGLDPRLGICPIT